MQRTETSAETELKAKLNELIANGAPADEITAMASQVAQQIIEAAEAEAALKLQTGHKWTDEQRAALSAKLKGRPGKPKTEEERAKMRASWTPEKRAQLSEKLKGRTLTPEQREKLSNSLKANKAAKEQAQKALQDRIAELEAQLQGQQATAVTDAASDVEDYAVTAEAVPTGRKRR